MDLLSVLAIALAVFLFASPFLIWNLSHRLKQAEKKVDELSARIDRLAHKTEVTDEALVTEARKAKSPEDARTKSTRPPAVDSIEHLAFEAQKEHRGASPILIKDRTTPPTPHPVKGVPEKQKKATGGAEWGTQKGWGESPTPILDEKLKALIFGGNTVARVGIVILFFGVAFFLKFAVEQGWLSIEMRLVSAAVGGWAMLMAGWRLRDKRREFALAIQGGGVGIVYLVVFAAVGMYGLIPPTPGLGLMLVLVALGSALAVLQNAHILAVMAAVGGFLAPVLIPHDGSHVTLFIYYAALDIGILAIAWHKAWRALNLVGFAFTFVIGGMWGYRFYEPALFASTEPFLILFFLLYLAIPILFAQRQPPELKGYVDGTLIFGVHLVAFSLQSRLVLDFEYGLAISALCMGLLYAGLSSWLWRSRSESQRMLTETFTALAVAFGTVAIPLAVDGRWTGAAWALEGAALIWIGVRQKRWLARLSGVAVQLGAGAAFLFDRSMAETAIPIFNSVYSSALMIAIAGLLSAFFLFRSESTREPSSHASTALLAWGLGWWFVSAGNEITTFLASGHRETAGLAFTALTTMGISYLWRRLDWPDLERAALLLLPVMVFLTVSSYTLTPSGHPLAGWGLTAWVLAFFVQYRLLRAHE